MLQQINEEVNLLDYLKILSKRKIIFLYSLIICSLCGFLVYHLMPDKYELLMVMEFEPNLTEQYKSAHSGVVTQAFNYEIKKTLNLPDNYKLDLQGESYSGYKYLKVSTITLEKDRPVNEAILSTLFNLINQMVWNSVHAVNLKDFEDKVLSLNEELSGRKYKLRENIRLLKMNEKCIHMIIPNLISYETIWNEIKKRELSSKDASDVNPGKLYYSISVFNIIKNLRFELISFYEKNKLLKESISKDENESEIIIPGKIDEIQKKIMQLKEYEKNLQSIKMVEKPHMSSKPVNKIIKTYLVLIINFSILFGILIIFLMEYAIFKKNK